MDPFRADCSPNDGDIQAAGKTFVFNTPLTSTSTPWKTFLGDKEFDYLGAHVALGGFGGSDDVLAIGVPVKSKYSMNTLVCKKIKI